jgi:tRNA nucleotidyltransferase (CCA-adding enzyme)
MLGVLRECGALARILPEIDRALAPDKLAARLDRAVHHGFGLPVRYALLALDVDVEGIEALSRRLNAPNDCRDLARIASLERDEVRRQDLDAESTLALLERCDAFRRADRLERLIEVAECDAHGEKSAAFVPRKFLAAALDAARGVDAGAIARDNPGDIPASVRRARLTAIAALQPTTGN